MTVVAPDTKKLTNDDLVDATPPRSSGPGEFRPPDSTKPAKDTFGDRVIPPEPPRGRADGGLFGGGPTPDGSGPPDSPFGGGTETTDPMTDPLLTPENSGDLVGGMQPFMDQVPGVTPEQTVAGQLDSILNTASPLWDYASGQGAQYANSRGLQNSDIGAQAGQQALFEQAVPIATADAATFARRADLVADKWGSAGLAVTQGTIDSLLSVQDHVEKMTEMARQGDINSRLQLEQYGYNFNLSVQDNIERMMEMGWQGDIDSRLALEAFGYDWDLMENDQGHQLNMMDRDLRNALAVDNNNHDNWLEQNNQQHLNTLDQIAAQGEENTRFADDARSADFTIGLQKGYLAYADVRGREYSREIQEIYSTEGLTPAQQQNAANKARQNYEDDMAMMKAFYTSNPYWDDTWVMPDLLAPGSGYVPNTGGDTGGDTTPGDDAEDNNSGGGVAIPPDATDNNPGDTNQQ